jgi:hypothetical protein
MCNLYSISTNQAAIIALLLRLLDDSTERDRCTYARAVG